MTDDALMVLANGAVMNRTEVISALEESPPWSAYEIDDVQVVASATRRGVGLTSAPAIAVRVTRRSSAR